MVKAMRKLSFVDQVLLSKSFKEGDVVRKTDLRDMFLSPYQGRVVSSMHDIGVVIVQWPWGNEHEQPSELVKQIDVGLEREIDHSYDTYTTTNRKISSIIKSFEQKTLPVYRMSCKLWHNKVDEIDAFVRISKELGDEFSGETIKTTISNVYNLGMKLSLYWADPKRKYKLTQNEKNNAVVVCPRCKNHMKPRVFRRGDRILMCKSCGFSIHPKDIVIK